MNTKLNLVSISLPNLISRQEIEVLLECSFKKGIEKAFYAEQNGTYIIHTPFNVLTFIHYSREKIVQSLLKLGIKEAENFEQHCLYQDYPILIDPDLELTCKVSNESIILKEGSALLLIIIALVVSQSVGIEKYEYDLDRYFSQSKKLIELTDSYSPLKRAKLTEFAKQLTLIQYDMVADLFLLDKPNILWDNEEAENLYNLLASNLELEARFEIVSYKLSGLKDDVNMVLDLANHKQSEILDWIIIILIAVAISIMILEIFFHK